MSTPAQLTLSDFLHLVFDGGEEAKGYVRLAVQDPYQDEFFSWPDELPNLLAFVDKHRGTRGVLFSPMLYTKRAKTKTPTKDTVCFTGGIWADLDTCNPNLLHIAPTVSWETSPGSFSCFLAVDHPVPFPTDRAEGFSRSLYQAHREQGCDSGWALTKMLRLPTSFNFKYAEKPLVFIREVTGRVYTQDDLAAKYPLPVAAQGQIPTGGRADAKNDQSNMQAKSETAKELLERFGATRQTWKLYEEPADDRSTALYGLERDCLNMGMTPEQTYVVCQQAACNKFDGHDDRLWADIQRRVTDLRTKSTKGTPSMTEATERDRRGANSTWQPIDLSKYLDGTFQPIEPAILTRTDGVKLLYPSAVHSIYGESESGKSWVFLMAAKEVLHDGGRVLFFDFESDPYRITERLRLLGVPVGSIVDRFTYIRPEERINEHDLSGLFETSWELVGIDGVTPCLAITGGYKGRSEDDIAEWMDAFPKKFSRKGAAVFTMDHVTKSNDGRGRFAIGSQYKLGGLDGASFTIEATRPFGKNMKGEAEIRIAKDRNGSLRRHGGKYRSSDNTQEFARLIVDALDPDNINAQLTKYAGADLVKAPSPTAAPTTLMEKCSRYIESNEDCLQGSIEKNVQGDSNTIRKALDELIETGYVERIVEGRSKKHRIVKSYREPKANVMRLDFSQVRGSR